MTAVALLALLLGCGARRSPPEPLLDDQPLRVQQRAPVPGACAPLCVEIRVSRPLRLEVVEWSLDRAGAEVDGGALRRLPAAAAEGLRAGQSIQIALPAEAVAGDSLLGTVHARSALGTDLRQVFLLPLRVPFAPPTPPAVPPESP